MIPGDPYYYPGTDILKNRFNITDAHSARSIEYKFSSARELDLRRNPIIGAFDFAHLQAIHKHLFGDFYSWAGEVRTIDFAKRNSSTNLVSQFAKTSDLPEKIAELNKFVADNKALKGLPKLHFVRKVTELHTKLNELNPFREGNGRAARLFLTQLAKEAGFVLDLTKIDKERWDYASHRAQVQLDPRKPEVRHFGAQMDMRSVFHEAITPTIAHAFNVESRDIALKLYPTLQAAYDRLDAVSVVAKSMSDQESAAKMVELARTRIVQRLHEEDPTSLQHTIRALELAAADMAAEIDDVPAMAPAGG